MVYTKLWACIIKDRCPRSPLKSSLAYSLLGEGVRLLTGIEVGSNPTMPASLMPSKPTGSVESITDDGVLP